LLAALLWRGDSLTLRFCADGERCCSPRALALPVLLNFAVLNALLAESVHGARPMVSRRLPSAIARLEPRADGTAVGDWLRTLVPAA
jgi:hypothetical protein